MAKSLVVKPLEFVQFSTAVNIAGVAFPVTQYNGPSRLDYEREEIIVGEDGLDVFPMAGGLVAHYRFKK